MVKVAICDDEPKISRLLHFILSDIFNFFKIAVDIDVFLAGEKLCIKIEAKEHYDLIFLDIEFAKNAISGVEVGQLIRNTYNNNEVKIVYISWEKDYAMQLFEVRPMDFLIKPLNYDKVKKTVNTFLHISGLNSGVFTYKKGHDTFEVRIKDIVYLENSKRKIIIYLASGKQEEFYGSLKEVYNEQLKNSDFLFTHASFAVNYDYVTAIRHGKLLVTDKRIPLPIAPNRSTEVKKSYLAITKKRRGV